MGNMPESLGNDGKGHTPAVKRLHSGINLPWLWVRVI